MPKVTLTNADGSTQDFFPQSYTDAAVAAVTPANTVAPEVTEVDLVPTDGSTKKFTAASVNRQEKGAQSSAFFADLPLMA
jgi:hypothetical protein